MGGPGSRGLAIDAYALHPSGTACLVTRYPGDLGGVTTLRQLVRVKGGKLAPGEAARAAEHLIEALELGEASGRMHGEFDLDSCVVDRGGRVAIELYGFRPRWSRGHDDVERLSWDHRASMARSVREMLGGDGLPRVWSEWSERLEQEPCVAWSEVRGSMPREVGVSSGTGTLVRTLWERVKQLAGKG